MINLAESMPGLMGAVPNQRDRPPVLLGKNIGLSGDLLPSADIVTFPPKQTDKPKTIQTVAPNGESIVFDRAREEVYIGERPSGLSDSEKLLVTAMMEEPGKIFTPRDIYSITHPDVEKENIHESLLKSVKYTINRIRTKLDYHPEKNPIIATERNTLTGEVGFSFAKKNDDFETTPADCEEKNAAKTEIVTATGSILSLDEETHRITLAGEILKLSKISGRLLSAMIQDPGKAFTKKELYLIEYPESDPANITDNNLESVKYAILRLKKLLGDSGSNEKQTIKSGSHRESREGYYALVNYAETTDSTISTTGQKTVPQEETTGSNRVKIMLDRGGSIVYDERAQEVFLNNENLSLRPSESRLLIKLMKEPGKIFSKEELYDLTTDAGKINVSRLRKKLGDAAKSEIPIIESVGRFGYRIRGRNDHEGEDRPDSSEHKGVVLEGGDVLSFDEINKFCLNGEKLELMPIGETLLSEMLQHPQRVYSKVQLARIVNPMSDGFDDWEKLENSAQFMKHIVYRLNKNLKAQGLTGTNAINAVRPEGGYRLSGIKIPAMSQTSAKEYEGTESNIA